VESFAFLFINYIVFNILLPFSKVIIDDSVIIVTGLRVVDMNSITDASLASQPILSFVVILRSEARQAAAHAGA